MDDICQRLRGRKNWVCPGGVPCCANTFIHLNSLPNLVLCLRVARHGYHLPSEPDLLLAVAGRGPPPFGGKFWVAQLIADTDGKHRWYKEAYDLSF